MKRGPQPHDGWFAMQALAKRSDIHVAAKQCLQALEKWERRTRKKTPTLESVHEALDQPLTKLAQTAARVIGDSESSWLKILHLELCRSVQSRNPRPRGSTPWGDEEPGGCDYQLHVLRRMLTELSGLPVDDPTDLLMAITARPPESVPMASKSAHRTRGDRVFGWKDFESKLVWGTFESTTFPGNLPTARKILKLLATLPSNRATTFQLDDAFEDREETRGKNNVDRHLSSIRTWLRGQPNHPWKAVDVVRDRDYVRLTLDPSRL